MRVGMSRLDLHLHTTHSDGSLSPAEVLRLAHKAQVTALAITDHDIVSGIPEAIEAGAELGIEIVPGVEIRDRKSTRLNSSHERLSRMPSSA